MQFYRDRTCRQFALAADRFATGCAQSEDPWIQPGRLTCRILSGTGVVGWRGTISPIAIAMERVGGMTMAGIGRS